MRNLDWNEGAPDEIVVGMALQQDNGRIYIVGHVTPAEESGGDTDIGALQSRTVRWAYLIQPYQLEWLEAMNKQHGKGKK
ncbi:hypothetical protein [Leptolyngbya phage Lbo-JY16]